MASALVGTGAEVAIAGMTAGLVPTSPPATVVGIEGGIAVGADTGLWTGFRIGSDWGRGALFFPWGPEPCGSAARLPVGAEAGGVDSRAKRPREKLQLLFCVDRRWLGSRGTSSEFLMQFDLLGGPGEQRLETIVLRANEAVLLLQRLSLLVELLDE